MFQPSSPLVNISASVGHGAYALGYQTAFDAGRNLLNVQINFLTWVFLIRQVCPHQAQPGGGLQRWRHDHPRHRQRLESEPSPASPAASSTILFTPAMIILSATGDQTQIVLRSADMSRPVTFTLSFQIINRLEIGVSCCSAACLALLTV